MNQRQEKADARENARGSKQHAPSPQQAAEIHCERADEHERHVVSAADPGAIVNPDAEIAFEICRAQGEHAAGQRDDSRAKHNP
jgi:hypothetical protein